MIKGETSQHLIQGSATFENVSINEVMSHLRHGWIFLVVSPLAFSLDSQTGSMRNGDNNNSSFIESGLIEPLILEKVVVKAKRYSKLWPKLTVTYPHCISY